MQIVVLIIGILIFVAVFCVLENCAKLPSIKASSTYSTRKSKKTSRLDLIAQKTAFIVPVSKMRELKVRHILKTAGLSMSPKEYIAGYVVRAGICAGITVITLLIWYPLAIIPALATWYIWVNKRNYAYRLSSQRRKETEKELPRFVSYISSRVKSSHNMIQIMTDYKANYDNIFTKEIAYTIADMKTGNQEQAIMNMQDRINSPLMTQLCRGLISAMRGDNVTVYFENFNQKLMMLWEQKLKEEALKKEPKISKMSYVLLGCAFLSVFLVLGATVIRAISLIQGV